MSPVDIGLLIFSLVAIVFCGFVWRFLIKGWLEEKRKLRDANGRTCQQCGAPATSRKISYCDDCLGQIMDQIGEKERYFQQGRNN